MKPIKQFKNFLEFRKKNTKITTKKDDDKFTKTTIDYKNIILLKKFMTPEGQILPKTITNVTSKQQRHIAKAIKRSRMIVLYPFQKPYTIFLKRKNQDQNKKKKYKKRLIFKKKIQID